LIGLVEPVEIMELVGLVKLIVPIELVELVVLGTADDMLLDCASVPEGESGTGEKTDEAEVNRTKD